MHGQNKMNITLRGIALAVAGVAIAAMLAISTALVVNTIDLHSIPTKTYRTPPTPLIVYDNCECSQVAMAVAWSLDNAPEDWRPGETKSTIARGDQNIWVSNGPGHVSIGPNFLAEGWSPEDEDRQLIWRAVQRWYRARLARELGVAP